MTTILVACSGGTGPADATEDQIAGDIGQDLALDSAGQDVAGQDLAGQDTWFSDSHDQDSVDSDATDPDINDISEGDVTDVIATDVVEVEPDVHVGPPTRVSENFEARGSVEQIFIRDAVPAATMQVVDVDGNIVVEGVTDEYGSLIFRGLVPARGYSVRPVDNFEDYTGPIRVMSVENSLPKNSFYEGQILEPGFGYLTTRDGTKLSYFLTLPGPIENGPYPTVVAYSGYSPSRPGRVLSSEIEPFCEIYPILCNAPDDPSNMIAALIGFATIGVNMRGTGCSDGGYDYFEPLQVLDGYDVIEIVGRQPWVKHNAVGMVGISFPGISQLFVGAIRPPHLGAIAPQSVIADSSTSVLLPGGIYNDGFAQEWHDMVLYAALPYHHGWVKDVINAGDLTCDRHQKMHLQQRDAIDEGLKYPYYTDEVAKPVDPSAWVDKINIPVFMTGQFQDEQTGPHFAALMDKFTGSPSAHFTVTNGFHNDSASPQSLVEWIEFLYLFVSKEPPVIPDDIKALGPMFMEQVFGVQIAFPDSDLEDMDNLGDALAAWNARPPVKVIFESGTNKKEEVGAPVGAFDKRFAAWPLPGTAADRWYMGPGGALSREQPDAEGGFSWFTHDADAGHRVTLASGGVYNMPPNWSWLQPVYGSAVEFLTPQLAETSVMVGHGSADLWIRTDATDADLEVTVTEVRPDGKEVMVQAGWLRASHRGLRADATELRPIKSHTFEDVSVLTPAEWTFARVEIMPMSHIFRAGSRIRVIIDTPGDSTTRWKFRLLEFETAPQIDIGHDADHPSSIALPLVPGIQVTTDLPACGALRGQPCRDYTEIESTNNL